MAKKRAKTKSQTSAAKRKVRKREAHEKNLSSNKRPEVTIAGIKVPRKTYG